MLQCNNNFRDVRWQRIRKWNTYPIYFSSK